MPLQAGEMADKLIGNSPSRLKVHRPRSAVPGQKLQSPYTRIPGWATPYHRISPDHHSLPTAHEYFYSIYLSKRKEILC